MKEWMAENKIAHRVKYPYDTNALAVVDRKIQAVKVSSNKLKHGRTFAEYLKSFIE